MTIHIDENTVAGRQLAEMIRLQAGRRTREDAAHRRATQREQLTRRQYNAYIGYAIAAILADQESPAAKEVRL